jgi:hypothetical protein
MSEITGDCGAFQLDFALHYLALGYSVLPVAANKHPIHALVSNGVHGASRDPAVIREWWAKRPHAEAAIAIDATFAIVDCDCHGHDEHGPADFERLAGASVDAFVAANGAPYATTPSGDGAHLYFSTCGRTYRTARLPGTAIQLRAAGHYCVAPGFRNGREWRRVLVPIDKLPPVPSFFDPLLEPVSVPRAALERMTIGSRTGACSVVLPPDPWAPHRARIAGARLRLDR